MNRKTVNIWIFGIGVLMLLVRPYLVYQLSGYSQVGKNPVKAKQPIKQMLLRSN